MSGKLFLKSKKMTNNHILGIINACFHAFTLSFKGEAKKWRKGFYMNNMKALNAVCQSCPLAGMGAKMTKNGFISACLARQAKEIKMDSCPNCKKGRVIKEGSWLGAPLGITIFIPKDWIPGAVIYPVKQSKALPWGKKREKRIAKYPFTTMQVGEIFEGDVIYKARIRSAASKITRQHKKKFISRIENDKIIFERIL